MGRGGDDGLIVLEQGLVVHGEEGGGHDTDAVRPDPDGVLGVGGGFGGAHGTALDEHRGPALAGLHCDLGHPLPLRLGQEEALAVGPVGIDAVDARLAQEVRKAGDALLVKASVLVHRGDGGNHKSPHAFFFHLIHPPV